MRGNRWLLVSFVALGACGSDERPAVLDGSVAPSVANHHARSVTGPTGLPIDAEPLLGLFTIPVRLDGVAGPPMLVDTGSPVTFVTPGAYGSPTRGSATSTVDLTVGALTLEGVPVVWADPFGLGANLGGVLGANLVCQFASTWDWQRDRFTLGAEPADADTTDDVAPTAFQLRGGGFLQLTAAQSIAVPPTRLLVDVEIESRTFHLILDTGASSTALRDDALAPFLADGRGRYTLDVGAQGGPMRQTLFRARRIAALGVVREGAVVVGYSAANLASLSLEVGARVDGLLGADFLRPWLTTIDYPAGRVHLRRYRDQSHVRDAWNRVGLFVSPGDGGAVVVVEVAAGSDAAQRGFAAGERLLSVDGRDVAGMPRERVDVLLRGAVGEMRHLRTDAREADVRVDDLIPLR
ncbi:MAG: hypothetical protein JWM10_5448 [Myxococcaceae bacterium]|nr:hypothetical protein [Myxococcaceae bacterium]